LVEEDSLMPGGQHLSLNLDLSIELSQHSIVSRSIQRRSAQTDFKNRRRFYAWNLPNFSALSTNWPFHLNPCDGIKLVVVRGAASMSKLSIHPDSTLLKLQHPILWLIIGCCIALMYPWFGVQFGEISFEDAVLPQAVFVLW
jgi:hypothetical protein